MQRRPRSCWPRAKGISARVINDSSLGLHDTCIMAAVIRPIRFEMVDGVLYVIFWGIIKINN